MAAPRRASFTRILSSLTDNRPVRYLRNVANQAYEIAHHYLPIHIDDFVYYNGVILPDGIPLDDKTVLVAWNTFLLNSFFLDWTLDLIVFQPSIFQASLMLTIWVNTAYRAHSEWAQPNDTISKDILLIAKGGYKIADFARNLLLNGMDQAANFIVSEEKPAERTPEPELVIHFEHENRPAIRR